LVSYLPLGDPLRDDAIETRAELWLLSLCASRKSLMYSESAQRGEGAIKGVGVPRSPMTGNCCGTTVEATLSSSCTQDSATPAITN
jgi:hypothetical protein